MSTVVLVHGAGSSPQVFVDWHEALSGSAVATPDLHEGLAVASATMSDYATKVTETLCAAERPLALCGWSMGGLVAAMAASECTVEALVLLEPSAPAEVQGHDPSVHIETGIFDPQQAYGPFPAGIVARSESTPARCERKRGISIPSLPTRTLVVYGEEFAEERGRAITAHYGCEELYLEGASHWDLVLDPQSRAAVADYLRRSGLIP